MAGLLDIFSLSGPKKGIVTRTGLKKKSSSTPKASRLNPVKRRSSKGKGKRRRSSKGSSGPMKKRKSSSRSLMSVDLSGLFSLMSVKRRRSSKSWTPRGMKHKQQRISSSDKWHAVKRSSSKKGKRSARSSSHRNAKKPRK